MLVERSVLHNFIVEVALAHFHHQICFISAYVQAVSREDVWVLAVEVNLALVDEEIQLDVLLSKCLHGQHAPAQVRKSQQYLSCLALAHPADHLKLILRLLWLNFPHHSQCLVQLPRHLRLLSFLSKILLSFVRFISCPRSDLSP